MTATTYTYDLAGRLRTVTDPKQQVTTYTYTLDNAVTAITVSNAQTPTPAVSYTYEPAYPRVTSMVDGTGTTSYTYHPAGQLGAGQLATDDGSLPNDTITYTYDALERVVTRAIDGVPLTLTYDALGRVTQEQNVLGSFGYGYDGASGRLATVTYPLWVPAVIYIGPAFYFVGVAAVNRSAFGNIRSAALRWTALLATCGAMTAVSRFLAFVLAVNVHLGLGGRM